MRQIGLIVGILILAVACSSKPSPGSTLTVSEVLENPHLITVEQLSNKDFSCEFFARFEPTPTPTRMPTETSPSTTLPVLREAWMSDEQYEMLKALEEIRQDPEKMENIRQKLDDSIQSALLELNQLEAERLKSCEENERKTNDK